MQAEQPENEVELSADWAQLEQQASKVDAELNPQSEQQEIEQAQAAEQELSIAELLTPAIKVTGDIFAPNWHLSDDECQQLGAAYGALIDKYLPDNDLSKYSVEIAAVMVTGLVFGSRIGKPLREKKPEKREQKTVNEQKSVTGKEQQQFSYETVLTPKAVVNE